MTYNRVVEILDHKEDDRDQYQVCREIRAVNSDEMYFLAVCEDKNGRINLYDTDDIRFVDVDAAMLLKDYIFEVEPIPVDVLDSIGVPFSCFDKDRKNVKITSRKAVGNSYDYAHYKNITEYEWFDAEGNTYKFGDLFWREHDGESYIKRSIYSDFIPN